MRQALPARLSTWIFATTALACTAPAMAQNVTELSQMSIEELSDVPVTSVSKREEPLSAAPAAIYVISNPDILRSSATSLPEVLREAPNLQVQRIDAREYAITARGFNGYDTANKLLVRIDGRSVYSTFHSGVFWELQNPLLEDIQRIEVVSGPGGTLYGANAVNGVINLSTRDASDTIGGLARGTISANERTAALRYGIAIGDSAAIRVYGTYFDREDEPAGVDPDYDDGFDGWQAGFRGDIDNDRDHVTLQGDIFGTDTRLLPEDGNWGRNLLARWTRSLDDNSSVQVQTYYDKYRRQYITVHDELETLDAEAQYNRTAGAHEIVAGLGARTTHDDFISGLGGFALDPESARLWFLNGFVQDRFAIASDLTLTGGLKVERSSFSGLEVLPNLRIGWQPQSDMLLWAAVSRAVRTPSRIDRELTGLPILAPAPDFRSEKLVAVEAGYRGQPTKTSSLSVSAYVNFYDDVRSTELSNGGLPVQLRNGVAGHTYGIEIWGTQQLASWWRVSGGVNLLGKDFKAKAGITDIANLASVGDDPSYQLQLRSQMNLSDRLALDVSLRAVDGLETPATPAYTEADARIGYMLTDAIEFYVAGNNLLHHSHVESNDSDQGQAILRSVYLGARLRL